MAAHWSNVIAAVASDFGLDPEQVGLDRDGATHALPQRRRSEHEFALHRRLGIVVRDDDGFERQIVLGILQTLNHGLGGQSMPQGIAPRARLVESVVAVNDARKAGMATRFIAALRGKTIAVLGLLTCKPETDDMRDAPSIPIIARLAQDGAVLRVFDPKGMTRRSQSCRPA